MRARTHEHAGFGALARTSTSVNGSPAAGSSIDTSCRRWCRALSSARRAADRQKGKRFSYFFSRPMYGFLGDRGTKRRRKASPHHNMLSSLSRARGLGPLLAPPARGVAGKVVASKRRPLPHKAVMELVPTAPPPHAPPRPLCPLSE